MTRIRTSAPVDPTDRFTQQIASLKEQVAELQRSGQSGPVWVSYTPILAGTGWSIGNGTIVGRAAISANRVDFAFKVTFGSTSTYGAANPTLTLPATPHTDWNDDLSRASTVCVFADATGNTYGGRCALSGSTVLPLVSMASGAYVSDTNVSSTVPFTWTNPDRLAGVGWYRRA